MMRTEGEYKSPVRKLVVFFEKSRDNWKAKYMEVKYSAKKLKNQVRYLKTRKKELKERVKVLEGELFQLRKEKEELFKKKDLTPAQHLPACSEAFDERVPYHTYSIGHMVLYLNFVLCASASLRCSSQVLEIVVKFFELPARSPSWSCGRLWLLRLAYFKLMRPKEKAADWVWIIDHTVQIGCEKCFVILGIRLSSLPCAGQCLRHEDVEPIALYPVKHSNGEIVFEQLEEATKITGVPREIIGDRGSDLVAGMKMFRQKHPETITIYDIKHKTAGLLKGELKTNERWLSFSRLCAKTARRVRQTDLAHLSPRHQRAKGRYMNIDNLVNWGSKTLGFVDAPTGEINPEVLQDKLGWIKDYREDIAAWKHLVAITAQTEQFVRTQGLYRGCSRDLKEQLKPVAQTDQSRRIRSKLISFVAEESFKAKPGERLLGSSEVIESVFGKLKYIERDQASSGFTGLVLSVAALVSKTTREVIRKAMETVRTRDVLQWCRTKIGKSVQAKKKALSLEENVEQKRDQIAVAVGT